jgi:hypothetical protein
MSGLETYTLTLAEHLALLGHEVTVFTQERGDAAAELERRGIRLVGDDSLPREVDVVLPQETVTAYLLADAYPGVPQVQGVHAHEIDIHSPPQLPGVTAAAIVCSDTVARGVEALARPPRVVRLRQPVDTRRFRAIGPPRETPRRLLLHSNYVHGERLRLMEKACDEVGLELVRAGSLHSPVRDVAWLINECDIVAGKARAVLEGMACGRAAYVFDHNGCDGWVTGESYPRLEADNFGGRLRGSGADPEVLASELSAYRPEMGLVNRDLVVAHHSAREHAQAIAGVCAEVAASPASQGGALREMSRLVWMQFQAELRALRAEEQLRAMREREWHQTQAADTELRRLQEEIARATDAAARERAAAAERESAREAEIQNLNARHADAEARAAQAREEAHALASTRRYRLVEAALKPLDAARAALSSGTHKEDRPAPAPFVVGVARSGTTLLRLMLDSHPDLAIPAETGWIPAVLDIPCGALDGPERLCAAVTGFETFPDCSLSADDLLSEVRRVRPFDTAEAVRAFYRLYAERHGKRRWGDKTPVYGQEMEAIATLLPEARFVHVIRDGRDVAVSVRPLHFSPGDDIAAIARDWRERVRSYRAAGGRLGAERYLELRYEDLLDHPEDELRRISAFLKLPFSRQMLDYHRRSQERLGEVQTRLRPDGSVLVTKEGRLHNHRFTSSHPDRSRVGRWRTELAPDAQREFEHQAGDLLAELGYTSTT